MSAKYAEYKTVYVYVQLIKDFATKAPSISPATFSTGKRDCTPGLQKPPNGKLYRDCKHAKASGEATGVHFINPSVDTRVYSAGSGIKVYCDMEALDGTGWALLGVRKRGVVPSAADCAVVTPNDVGKVLPDESWAPIRDNMYSTQQDWRWGMENKGQ